VAQAAEIFSRLPARLARLAAFMSFLAALRRSLAASLGAALSARWINLCAASDNRVIRDGTISVEQMGGLEQTPVAGSQTPASWHASSADSQTFPLPPVQRPP
jgi:hypothetical protein